MIEFNNKKDFDLFVNLTQKYGNERALEILNSGVVSS